MSVQSVVGPLPRPSTAYSLIERLLRDRPGIWRQIAGGNALPTLARQMMSTSIVTLACYGMVPGLSHSPLQAAVSAVKLPFLYLLTLVICLPTLYFFNLLGGGRLTAWQIATLALAGVTMPAVLVLAFVPVSIFFLVTTPGYLFGVLLNIGILALTSVVGLKVLFEGAHYLNGLAREADNSCGVMSQVNLLLLPFWLLLFAFVGTQLAWTLRPFFGDPAQPFALFRPVEGNFYLALGRILGGLLF